MTALSTVPRVSVALSVYDNARHLDAAIGSILGQSFADFELLIVNDGSTDGSAAIIDGHAARDPRVRAFHQPNRGLVPSLNRMIAEARAPLIARMDGDDVALPERFAQQVAFLDAHPDHGLVGSQVERIDEHGAPCADSPADYPLDSQAIEAGLRSSAGPESRSVIAHPTVMLRRALLVAVGGYRPAFRHSEDYDLWLRLAEITRLANLPERLLRYRVYSGQVSKRHKLEQTYGAAIARAADIVRRSGRPDPTAGLAALPPIDAIDALFEAPGLARDTRATMVRTLLYPPATIGTAERDLVRRHLSETRGRPGERVAGLWRAVARFIWYRDPRSGLRLGRTLFGR